jgi:hypothetical protein
MVDIFVALNIVLITNITIIIIIIISDRQSMVSFSRMTVISAAIVTAISIGIAWLQRTTWWAGYNLDNCLGCQPIVNWSAELEVDRIVVDAARYEQYQRDGVILLPGVISPNKVNDLAEEVDALPDTFMSHILANTLLPQYLSYEHRIDTRSELVRDWAVHGPLGTWAAQLMGAKEVRLYNAEKIYHRGFPCRPAWHRDTIAAPFPTEAKSITINIYLDEISGGSDVLIYMPGSHHNITHPPKNVEHAWEPHIHIGDVLAHDPRIYHTPSGKGCWPRRSLQFRYVESPTTFSFAPNRFPHGPVPWTFAHAAGVAPHGLTDGDALQGPWYPRVVPSPLASEHVPLPKGPWSLWAMLGVAKEAQDIIQRLGIVGTKDSHCNTTLQPDNNNNNTDGHNHKNNKEFAYFGFDGPIIHCQDWELVQQLPLHKDGQMFHTMNKDMAEGRE